MSSHLHEAIAELLSESPSLIADLLSTALGIELPPYASAVRADTKLTDLSISEYRCDGVTLFRDANGTNVACIVVEVQLRRDSDKPWVWPAYVTLTRARHRCRTDLLAVTVDEATAAWARTSVSVGEGCVFRPLVVGPGLVPRLEDIPAVVARPELAVLSALAHSREESDAKLIRAVLVGLSEAPLEGTRFGYYRDVIEQSLSAAVRRALEAQMPYPGYEPQSEVSKAVFRGLAQGKAEGKQEGLLEGKAEGKLEGIRGSLRSFLSARGLVVTTAQSEQIDACDDVERLNDWVRRAASVASTDELLGRTEPNS